MSKLALVTGATKGIGRASALQLAAANMHIIATGRNIPDLESLQQQISQNEGTCDIVPADLNDTKQLSLVIKKIKQTGFKLDALIHSAGLALVGNIASMEIANWEAVIKTNLSVPFYLTQQCLSLMDKGSHIIFINSVAGKLAFTEWAAYCASKAGLRTMADVLRQEVAKQGIRVTTIYPASVDTPMQKNLPYNWDTSKMLQPDDVARAVKYCVNQPDNVIIKELDLENPAGIF
jgi:NADP-dependent 3-hydroxy acid dehydrogenase YdfG